MFSSHPDLDKRIKTMSKRAQKDGFARPENKMPEKVAPEKPAAKKTTGKKTAGTGKKTAGKRRR